MYNTTNKCVIINVRVKKIRVVARPANARTTTILLIWIRKRVFLKKIIRHINRILELDTRESIKIRFHILAHFRIDIVNRIRLSILLVIQMVNTIRAAANSHHAVTNLFQLILIQSYSVIIRGTTFIVCSSWNRSLHEYGISTYAKSVRLSHILQQWIPSASLYAATIPHLEQTCTWNLSETS